MNKSVVRAVLGSFLLLSATLVDAKPTPSALRFVATASTFGLVYASNAFRTTAMGGEIGYAEDVILIRTTAKWDLSDKMLEIGGYDVSSYLMFDLGNWQSSIDLTQNGSNKTMGLTPIFRLQKRTGSRVYYETAIGISLYSSTKINGRDFGIPFQFSEVLGWGVLLGERRQWELTWRFQHLSNNALALPNNGIDFNLISLAYRY